MTPQRTAPDGPRSAVLYARVSSKDQEKEGYSIPAQEKLLREYAREQGLRIAHEYVDVETAKQAGRTSFSEMLAFFRRTRRCRVLLVEKTDRLYRNLKDWVNVDELDLEIHFVKENVVLAPDSKSAEKFMHGIKVLMAKNYVDNLSEEVKKGHREKAEEGGWPTFAPVGYINVAGADGKRALAVDEERAALVSRTFEWYAGDDLSIKQVAQRARQAGFSFRKSGRPISTAKVHQMLRQRMYCGEFEWGGKLYRGTYPAIISRQLWDRVQEILDERAARRPKVCKHRFTFTGLVVCSRCGCAVVGEMKKRRYVYYRCTGNRGHCEERDKYVREEVLAEQFATSLQEMSIEPHILEWVAQAMRSGHADEKRFRDDAITRLEGDHRTLQTRLDTMYVDKLDGRINGAYYEHTAAKWRAEQDRIAEAIARHRTADRSYVDQGIWIWNTAGFAAETFRKAQPAERRELAGVLVQQAGWGAGRLDVTFKPPFDVILREVRKVRATEGSEPGSGTRTRPNGADSNRPKGPNPSTQAAISEVSSAEIAKWREGGDSNPRRNFLSLTRLAGGRFQPLSHLPGGEPSIGSVRLCGWHESAAAWCVGGGAGALGDVFEKEQPGWHAGRAARRHARARHRAGYAATRPPRRRRRTAGACRRTRASRTRRGAAAPRGAPARAHPPATHGARLLCVRTARPHGAPAART